MIRIQRTALVSAVVATVALIGIGMATAQVAHADSQPLDSTWSTPADPAATPAPPVLVPMDSTW